MKPGVMRGFASATPGKASKIFGPATRGEKARRNRLAPAPRAPFVRRDCPRVSLAEPRFTLGYMLWPASRAE